MNIDRLFLVGLLGFVAACPADQGASTDTDADDDKTTVPADTEGTDTEGADTEGETTGGFLDQLAEGCGLEHPCNELKLVCGLGHWKEDCAEPFSAETRCALDRLAAGEAFPLRFNLNGYNGEVEWYDIIFDGKGGAIRQNWFSSPEGGPDQATGSTEQCQLLSTDAFADCLAAPNDDPSHAACMMPLNWFTKCEAVEDPVCPAL